jgi:hypothetical protein
VRSGRNAASRVFSVRVVRVLGVVARGNAVNFAAGMATALEAGRCRLREPRVYASRTGLVCGQRTGVCADVWSVADAWAWCRHAQNGAKGAHRGVRRHGARLGGACGGFRWGRGLGELCVRLCLGAFAVWTVFAQQEGLHVVRCQGQPRGCRAGRVGWCCLSQRSPEPAVTRVASL